MKPYTPKEFYTLNEEIIEHWLDLALYKPERNVPDKIPNKLDYNNNKNFRRFCLLRHLLRLSNLIDLSKSKKVLDIGAGFGDFLILSKNYNLEKIDATDPSIYQYKFISEKFNYYNNVYNLPMEEIDMTEYDTIVLSGIWVPNWTEAIKQYILPNNNLKNVFITTTLLHNNSHLILDAENIDPAPWKYDREGDRKLISLKMMNLVFKSKNFYLKNSFFRKNDPARKMTAKYYLHYQRD
jgi:SAM-dependent methyltransferase